MGLVFDPERVGAGKIPADANGQAQYDAAIVLGESLAELAAKQPYKNPELLAYMIYGSANKYHGSIANRRSDVDLLVVTNTFVETSLIHQAVRERIRGVGPAFNVDVNPIIYSCHDLEGNTRVNPFYAEHLASVRGFITDRCLQYFTFDWDHRMGRDDYATIDKALFGRLPFVEAWPFAIEYLKARREQFQTQLDQTEPSLTALKGPFELPRNLGRTLAGLFNMYISEHDKDAYDPESDEVNSPVSHNNTHQQNLLSIADTTGNLGLIGEDIERLIELDANYSSLLEATVSGDVLIADYEKWLQSVYIEAFERAFKIVSLADAIVYKTVEMAQLDPNYDTIVTSEYDEDYIGFIDVVKPSNEAGFLQVVPKSYDIARLVFSITPRFPELAKRYHQTRAFKEEARRQDFENWQKEEAEILKAK